MLLNPHLLPGQVNIHGEELLDPKREYRRVQDGQGVLWKRSVTVVGTSSML